jgi:hypothetical protein
VQYKRIARPAGARPNEKRKTPETKKRPDFHRNAFQANNRFYAYAKLLTNLVSFDLLFEALFLWITFFLAKRSSIEITLDNKGAASALAVVLLNLLMAFLVVLA